MPLRLRALPSSILKTPFIARNTPFLLAQSQVSTPKLPLNPLSTAFPAPRTFSTVTMASPVFKSGNTALITGGASGIGLALATKCADYGMNVIICDNNSSNLSSAKSAIKGKVVTMEMDVSKVEDFEKLKGKIEKEFGGTSPSNCPSSAVSNL